MNKSLIKNTAQIYVMSKYLSKLCQQIGQDNYLNSYVSLEHGIGTGFFGIGNSGSTDCTKERIRGITDSLNYKYSSWKELVFVSQSCLNLSSPNFKTQHRVEHTNELHELYSIFEEDFIMSGRDFTPNEIATWVIENQIVCLISQGEQRSKHNYNKYKPFSKYTVPIFYNGTDVSDYSLADIMKINQQLFSAEIEFVNGYDFTKAITKQTKRLLERKAKHTLPPFDIAVKYHNDQFELLERHYQHKLKRRITKGDSRYDELCEQAYNNWKSAQ